MRKIKQLLLQSYKPLWIFSIIAAIIVSLFSFTLKYADTDLYYIIPTGNYILEHGLPYENPFITTPGCSIVIQNWLYCVVVAFVYSHLKSAGLWLLQTIFVLGMFVVTSRFLKKKTHYSKLTVYAATILIMFAFSYINLRPEMLTYLLIMIELIAVEEYKDTKKHLYLLAIPLTTLLEVNMHASYWVMHLIVLMPYIVPAFSFLTSRIKNDCFEKKERRMMYPYIVVAILSSFLNPYGKEGVFYLYNAMRSGAVSFSNISEQQSPELLNKSAIIFMLMICITMVLWQKKKLTSTELYMFLGFAILLPFAYKWISFFVIGMAYILRKMIQIVDSKHTDYVKELKCPVCVNYLFIIVIFAVLFFHTEFYGFPEPITSNSYLDDVGASAVGYEELSQYADYLDENDKDASIYADFHLANYFEYRGYKIYFDARPELYAKEITKTTDVISPYLILNNRQDVLEKKRTNRNENVYCNLSDYKKAIKCINTDYILARKGSIMHLVLEQEGAYKSIMDSESYTLFKTE